MLIYQILNNINKKIYIGKTGGSFKRRLSSHKSESKRSRSSQPIHKAMRKYGFDNFSFIVVEDGILDVDTLNEREKYYIDLFNSNDRLIGYNITNGGDGGPIMFGKNNSQFGKKRKDLTDRNKANSGKTFEELYGTSKAQELKSVISKTSSGRIVSEETKKKNSVVASLLWAEGRLNREKAKSHAKKIQKNAVKAIIVKVFCPELNKTFESITEAAKYINGVPSNISSVVNGKLKRYKGFTFVRVKDGI